MVHPDHSSIHQTIYDLTHSRLMVYSTACMLHNRTQQSKGSTARLLLSQAEAHHVTSRYIRSSLIIWLLIYRCCCCCQLTTSWSLTRNIYVCAGAGTIIVSHAVVTQFIGLFLTGIKTTRNFLD